VGQGRIRIRSWVPVQVFLVEFAQLWDMVRAHLGRTKKVGEWARWPVPQASE
jgi:hypothetical protein